MNKLPPLTLFDRRDFEDIEFWERSEWESWVVKEKEKGVAFKSGVKGEGKNSSWMENADGTRVNIARQGQIIAGARHTWLTLKNCHVPLGSFRDTDERITSYFRRKVETEFDELRFCSNHWKADRLWMENFSSWRYRPLDTQDGSHGNEMPLSKPISAKVSMFHTIPPFHLKRAFV